jgi:hypothetical protein
VELHTCLWNDAEAFHFEDSDFDILRRAMPGLNVIVHDNELSFLEQTEVVEAVIT